MKPHMRPHLHSESGSVLTALFIGIGLLGFLSFATYNLLNGPIRSAATVSMKSKTQSELMLTAKLLMRSASDIDGDGVFEPPEFNPATTPKPLNGGGIPLSIGAAKIDPWHIPYGYCVWDHGSINASANRLSGAGDTFNDKITLAVISAGPNRVFDTSCADDPGTYLTSTANSDDIIESYTFDQAQTLELWKKRTDGSNMIEYTSDNVIIGSPLLGTEKLQVGGDGRIDGNLNVSGSGVINGGLNATAIGQSTAAAGAFTDLISSGLVSLTGTGGLSGINNISIGTVTPAAGIFTNLGITGVFTVASNALVTNLNADFLDGQHGTYYQDATNMNAGTLDPARMPAFTGDSALTRTNATTANATVTGLQGNPVAGTAPVEGQALVFSSGSWLPGGITLTGDVTGTTTATAVVRIQGRAVNGAAPTANSVLGWDGTQWKPMVVAAGAGTGTTIGSGGVNYLATDGSITIANCPLDYIVVSNGATWGCRPSTSLAATTILPIDVTGETLLMVNDPSGSNNPVLYSDGNVTTLGRDAGKALTSGNANNTLIGFEAGMSLTTDSHNTMMGDQAGKNITGMQNAILGAGAGEEATNANHNVLIGYDSGKYMGAGSRNIAIGQYAGQYAKSSNNVFIGYLSGAASNTTDLTGPNNVFVGHESGRSTTTGSSNTYIGRDAGREGTTAAFNVNIGFSSGRKTTTGIGNVMIGFTAGNENLTGRQNVYIGSDAGYNNTNGNHNIFMGHRAGYNVTSGFGNIIMGNQQDAISSTSNDTLTLGSNRSGVGTFMQADMLTGPLQVKGGTTTLSDARLKKDITTLDGSLDKILSLRGVSYYWKPSYNAKDTRKHVGFIAQEVQEIVPEVVYEMPQGKQGTYLTVSYETLVPVLVEAIKEQNITITDQAKEIDELKSRMDRLEKMVMENTPRPDKLSQDSPAQSLWKRIMAWFQTIIPDFMTT